MTALGDARRGGGTPRNAPRNAPRSAQPRPGTGRAAVDRPAERVRAHAPDYVLLTAVVTLLAVGLIAVYSSSYALGVVQFDDANHFVKRQAFWAVVGLAGMAVTMRIDYRRWITLSPLLMVLAIGGLVLALVPGFAVEQNGASRWVGFGPLVGQPSEFAKFAVLIYMSAWFAAKGEIVRDFSLGVAPFLATVGLICSLVILEPDLGTTIMIALITGTLFFVSGARLYHLLWLVGSALGSTALLIWVGGYGMNRITSFTSAEADPQGVGFHTLQLLLAFGSGGLTGLGLGVSRQKFFYVPGSHTDGVLAILGEELGYIGVLVVIGLFTLLLWRALRIARRAADSFGSLLAVGVAAWIAFQLLLNVGGVTRLIPLTGIPLPLVSFGGSSLAVTLVSIGVLLSVSRYAALTGAAPVAHSGVVRAGSGAAPSAPRTRSGGAR